MPYTHINRVVLVGNLTRDPEMRATPSGLSVCSMRVACNGSRRAGEGEWEEKPNFFDVTVFGAPGESAGRFLAKGRPVAIDGRLDWREWQTADGTRREAVSIIAETVQFLRGAEARTGEDGELAGVGAGGEEGDLPF